MKKCIFVILLAITSLISISCQNQTKDITAADNQASRYITLRNPTSEQFKQAILNLKTYSRLRIFGGEVSINEPLNVSYLHDVEITADPPLTILNHQLGFSDSSLIKISGIRFHGFRDKSQAWLADYMKKWRGFEGRGLVVYNCQDVLVKDCSFANYTDDMAGAGGPESARIKYENCLFHRPLGIYRKGSLFSGGSEFLQIENFSVMERCIYVGVDYRTPKLEGGYHEMIECGVIDNQYPIELKQPNVAAVACFFCPAYTNWRRMFNLPNGKLTLYGNYLSGIGPDAALFNGVPEDQWAYFVGNLRQTIDRQQGVTKTEQLPDRWGKVMTKERAIEIINNCGPKGANQLDDFAKWWATERINNRVIG